MDIHFICAQSSWMVIAEVWIDIHFDGNVGMFL